MQLDGCSDDSCAGREGRGGSGRESKAWNGDVCNDDGGKTVIARLALRLESLCGQALRWGRSEWEEPARLLDWCITQSLPGPGPTEICGRPPAEPLRLVTGGLCCWWPFSGGLRSISLPSNLAASGSGAATSYAPSDECLIASAVRCQGGFSSFFSYSLEKLNRADLDSSPYFVFLSMCYLIARLRQLDAQPVAGQAPTVMSHGVIRHVEFDSTLSITPTPTASHAHRALKLETASALAILSIWRRF